MTDTIARAQAGDRAAMNTVLREQLPGIRRRVHRYVRPPAADDVVQDVLIAVARGLPSFRGDCSLASWCVRIAVRTSFHHLRSTQNIIPFPEDFEPVDQTSAAARFDARDDLRALERVLTTLSPERRMVFILQDVEGYSAPEVAELLNIPVGTVYGRLRDARRMVQDTLTAQSTRSAGGAR